MKITKKEMWLAIFLSSLLYTASANAVVADCPAGPSCGSCGYESSSANMPSYASCVTPLTNYVATVDTARCGDFFSGLYLGVAWGLGSIKYNLDVNGLGIPTTIGAPLSGLDSTSKSYLVAIFSAGFNLVLDHFLVGIEVGYNYRSRVSSISYFDLTDFIEVVDVDVEDAGATSVPCKIHLDINPQHAVSIDLLPGFVGSRFAGYLRLGVEQSYFTWERRVCFPSIFLNSFSVSDNIAIIEGHEFAQSIKKTASGYRLGLGFAIAASSNVSLHFDYIHIFGSKITFTPDVTGIAANVPIVIVGGGPDPDPVEATVSIPELAGNNVIEPQRNELIFGVRFRF